MELLLQKREQTHNHVEGSLSIKLALSEIEDTFAKENFKALQAYLNSKFLLNFEFKLLSHTFKENGANIKLPHGLGITPLDVIQTSKIGSGVIVYNYDKFDSINLDVTITGVTSGTTSTHVTVRALVGTYREQ